MTLAPHKTPLPALLALTFIALLVGGAFIGLGVEAARDPSGALQAFDGYLLRLARFTLWQAALSTLLSVLPALALARAFNRHAGFPGRGLILRLFALPLALPAIVAALGILALLGRAGLFAPVLSQIAGSTWPGVYGLSGILVAHVFFNLPLATRLFLQALETVPADQWRLAAQLGMGAGPTFRLVEWPALRSALPGIAGLVFMLCVTSFTIVLTLGGGPRASTLEVAIYQALRFDFDPARAVALTLVQILLTVLIVIALSRLGGITSGEAALSVSRRNPMPAGGAESVINIALIALATVFVAGPLAAIVLSGLQADLGRLVADPAVQRATLVSLALAACSAALAVALSWSLAAGRRVLAERRRRVRLGMKLSIARLVTPTPNPSLQGAGGHRSAGAKSPSPLRGGVRGGGTATDQFHTRLTPTPLTTRPSLLERLMDTGAGFVLVVPPIVIGSGWFMWLRQATDVLALAPVMVIAVNAVMAMPFVIRAIRPAYDAAGDRHDRLAAQLGIAGWNRLRLIDWPAMRRPVSTGLAFAMALSLGEPGVIALFGSDAVQTLPYLLLGRMGSYRTADAAGIALLLGIVCLALMLLADRLGKDPAHA